MGMFAIAQVFAGAVAEEGRGLGFTVAVEGEEAGEFGDTAKLEKEKSSLNVEIFLIGTDGPWALNQEWQGESGQLLGSGAEKEVYFINGIRPGNCKDFSFFGTQISRLLL
jgi:hypothetical protein